MSIRLKDVSYTYNPGTKYESRAVKNVSLEIGRGEFVGIIGHTGSGKSTLIQMFNALLKPTSGDVFYNEENIRKEGFNRKSLRFNVGLVFQYPEYQFFEASVLKDVCFGPLNKGCSEDEAEKAAREALRLVGAPKDIFDKSPFEISGGLKRRVAIAGVLAMEPEFLILDEPTAGLDPKGKNEILRLLSKLHKTRGVSVVMVSHSMEDMAKYAERLIVMNKGSLVFDGSAKEVFSHYKELETMSLAAPQITYIMNALKDKGLLADTSAITVEEAKSSILAALGRQTPC